MADTETQPTSHQLVQILEEEHRPGGAWIYHADPDWSPSAAIVFPERILLRITPAAGVRSSAGWKRRAGCRPPRKRRPIGAM